MSINSQDNSRQPPLAVVGLSALFPKAANLDEFWSNIRRGVDAITEVPATHWNPDDYFDSNQKTADMTYARRGGFLSPLPFDPLEFGISPNNLEAIDTSQLLGLVGAKRALEHAGYGAGRTFNRSRVGCILGVTGTLEMVIPLGARLGHPRWRKALKDAGVADDVAEDVVHRISESYVPWQENSFPGLLGNVVAGRIANRLDLHGTNCVVDAACASSLSAIHLAALELWTGRSDMVVTGGIDTFNDIFMFMCFSKTPALSPSGNAKPFSDEADGTILGEGVGMLVLKRQADAERDGDRIYAILKGIGTSSDGAGNAVYAPKAEGQIRCLQDAYAVAAVDPATVELVEAHGTGTKVGDATEVSGLMNVYQATGRKGAWCAVGSVKSQIGHTKAAAGAAGVIKAILALQHKVLPPTIKVNQPPAAMLAADSPFYVNTEARPWLKPTGYPRRAAVSAFGFGGSNFHCVLEESPQAFDEPEWDGEIQVVALSAGTSDELANAVRTTVAPIAGSPWPNIRAFATSSRQSFRVELPHRILLVIERDKTDVAKLAAGTLSLFERYAEKTSWSTPDGAYYGRGARNGKLGILFPGQGSQYVGMLRELTCRFPVMSDVLSEANEVFASVPSANGQPHTTNRLSDYVFPHPAFSAEARSRQENDLRATQIAQPAIGAISLAVLSVLDKFGVRPEAVAGHSYGELTALCASRRFAPQVLYRLSMLRGQLMAAAQEVDGGMLAVGAPLTQIEAALKELSVDLVVANHNSPTQVVLSGRVPEIDRATSLLAARNIRGKKLSVAAAFHSPLVAPASRNFRPVLDQVEFNPSSMPVYANSTATEYPAEPQAARDLLASQLARPVHFVSEIQQMYADGVRTFLEVGPGAVLTGLVNSILNGSDYRAMAVDSSSGKRGGLFDLATALVQLSAAGHAVQWDQWDPQTGDARDEKSSSRMRIPISGANYVKPRPPIPPRTIASTANPPVGMPIQPVPLPFENTVDAPPVPSVPVRETSFTNPSVSASAAPLETSRPMTNPTTIVPAQSPPIAIARVSNLGSLETVRQALATLERMQHETSRLHQQFLEGQDAALQMFARFANAQFDERPFEAGHSAPFTAIASPASVTPAISKSEFPAPPPQSPQETMRRVTDAIHQPAMPQPAWPSAAAAPSQATFAAPPAIAPSALIAVPTSSAAVPAPVVKSAAVVTAASPLASIVMAVVSEKTGYPTEMLSLEMSLDHDLGIDSIKRVEILSALQERVPNLPAFQPEELGALHTLNDVVALADARSAPSVRPAAASPRSTTPVRNRVEEPASAVIPQPAAATVPPAIHSANSQPSRLGPVVLAVVSEKTGYPTEMLNLEMSLDHDLGIDSIKRVEILSALQERVPNLPAFQPEELGALHTLKDVVALADARSSIQTASSGSVPASNPDVPAQLRVVASSIAAPVVDAVQPVERQTSGLASTVLSVVSEKTGYPVEMLNLEMSLDHDLGIDSIKRVEILSALQERVPNLPAFQPEELGALHTLQDVVTLADARCAGSAVSAPFNAAASTSKSAAETLPTQFEAAQSSSAASLLGPTVLEVVSEKTGYPVEMLNLEMSLDHDLGIDSIKRVEILSALQERVPNLPAFQPEELGALHTLKDVVTLADARMSGSQSSHASVIDRHSNVTIHTGDPLAASQSASPPVAVMQTISQSSVSRSIVTPVLMMPATSRPRFGIAARSEVWIVADDQTLSSGISNELTRQGLVPSLFNFAPPQSIAVPNGLAGLIIVAPERGMTEGQLWNAVEWLQKAGPALRHRAATSPAFVVTVCRLDGQFGFGGTRPLHDPLSGGLAGIAKCASREWPEVCSRAFDLGQDYSAPHLAATTIVTELLHQGPVEVGLTSNGSYALEVVEQSLNGQPATAPLRPKEVVVISGGARGVTAEAALAVARAWQSTLVVLGRSPEPAPEPNWLVQLHTNAEIKRALIARAPTGTLPKAIAAQCQQILATREVTGQLQRLRSAGTTVIYHSVDVRDPNAVKLILNRVRQDFGPIRGIIHGAGVLADQRIEDKTLEQFERVYQTKIQGLKSLIDSLDPNELTVLGLFSSYTARYGRVGQLDYAIANEVLNKQARQFSIQHPRCQVASFNWGPWDGGMVQGGLKQLFASEGVGLIPLQAGADAVVNEFSQTTSRPVEVLVLAPADVSQARATNDFPGQQAIPISVNGDRHGLGSTEAAQSNQPDAAPDFKVDFERELDLERNPFLESHVLGGKAVLPVAVMLEWLAHGAIHRNAGLELRGMNDFRVYQGIRLGANDRVPLRVLSSRPVRQDDCFHVPMQLMGTSNGRDVLHAAGTLVLASYYPTVPGAVLTVPLRPYSTNVITAYANRLFHGPQFQGLVAIEGVSEEGIVVTSRVAPAALTWMQEPARGNWLADPLAIDAALQAIILWTQEERGKPCLPCAVTKYRQYRRAFPRDGVRIVVRVQPGSDQIVRCDVEFLDAHGIIVAQMEGCESVAEASLNAAFRKNRVEIAAHG